MFSRIPAASLATVCVLASNVAVFALTPIFGWGANPTNLTLELHVPAQLPAKPPVLLALHGCGHSGSIYEWMTGYSLLADIHGFIVMYPSTIRDNHCWDISHAESLLHNGGGDTTGLAAMIQFVLRTYAADTTRVFSTGSSSGCAMTQVLAATYPDLLAACTCYSGAAAGCLAGSEGFSPQTMDPACAMGKNVKTGAEWAAVARAMYPGYTGGYPRMATWHGTEDWLSSYGNLAEEIKQWSMLLGVEWTRNVTDTPEANYTQMVFGDGSRFVAYSALGVGHTVPVHAMEDLKWFGLV